MPNTMTVVDENFQDKIMEHLRTSHHKIRSFDEFAQVLHMVRKCPFYQQYFVVVTLK